MSVRRLLLIVVAGLLMVAPAHAAKWQRIATGGMNVSDQAGLGRTADGVLHVLWRSSKGAGSDLLQTAIAPDGTVGSTTTVVTGWSNIGSPAVVAKGQTLTVFFPGTKTTVTGDPTEGLDQATSTDGGATWDVEEKAIATNDFAAARTPAAVLSSGGTFLQAWYGAEQTVVHSGLNPDPPGVDTGYGQGTDQALAANNFNQVKVAWCTVLQDPVGVSVASVDPATGRPAGPVTHLPDTGRCGAETRVQLVGAPDAKDELLVGSNAPVYGDFFVGASSESGRKVKVFQLDRAGRIKYTGTVASGRSVKQQVALASTALQEGLWAGWRDASTDEVMITHLQSGIDWGADVAYALPKGQGLYQLAVGAQRNRADAVITVKDDANEVSLFTKQVFPGLTLTATKGTSFKVTAAAKPVSRATVTVGKRTFTTNGNGAARIRPNLKPGRYTATASKDGYASATLRFKVK